MCRFSVAVKGGKPTSSPRIAGLKEFPFPTIRGLPSLKTLFHPPVLPTGEGRGDSVIYGASREMLDEVDTASRFGGGIWGGQASEDIVGA